MTPIDLTGLYPQAYEHPDDAAALEVLQHTPGLETLVRRMSGWGLERVLRIQQTGSALKVTPDSFPDVWNLMITARDRLSLPLTPELYITSGEEINAFTAGTEKPAIVLNRGAIDRLAPDELLFVIAHEVGHIKSGHVLYYQIANYIPSIGGILGEFTLGIGNLLTQGLQIALLHWQRTAELTADRAGLLACQNPETAFRATMMLAGMPDKYAASANTEAFLQQAQEFDSREMSKVDKVVKYISTMNLDHPWTVLRAKELLSWIQTGGYDQVLQMPFPLKALTQPAKRFCDRCGAEALPGNAFCNKCGNTLCAHTS